MPTKLKPSFNTVAVVYADGLAEPNPGTATWAFTVYHRDQLTYREYAPIPGENSNNVAEYYGVGKALHYIREVYKRNDTITIRIDSQLVLNQVWGEWACNHEHLRKLRDRCRVLVSEIERQGIVLKHEWVKSAENRADQYTRVAYTEATGRQPKNWKKGVAK